MLGSPRTLLASPATLALALVSALAAALGALAAPASAAPGPDSVTVTGYGWGHAHGMSQYGAKEAAEGGASVEEILKFYYPGTAMGTARGVVRVLLTANTTNATVVGARSRLLVRSLRTGQKWTLNQSNARRWRLTPINANRDTRLWVLTDRWRRVRDIRGLAEFRAGGAPIRFYRAGGSALYRGALRSAVPEGGVGRDTVNAIALENYLRGVVPAEMPASWSASAVQAQAVAARTYVWFERADTRAPHYDLCDTTSCQVYYGYDREHAASDAAIRATAGQIRTYEGQPIFAQFSSSNGGWTYAGSRPYLVSQKDEWDPRSEWSATLTDDRIEASYPGIGDFEGLTLTKDSSAGGRVTKVRIDGSTKDVTLTADAFRSRFGLRSTMFSVG